MRDDSPPTGERDWEASSLQASELTAATADPFALYQDAFQIPEGVLQLIEWLHRNRRRSLPLHLREDFCGTGYLGRVWVESHPRRSAVGLDRDTTPLRWGRTHNRPAAGASSRLRLVQADVRVGWSEPSDVIAALNFSYSIFHERHTLLQYFRSVREGLSPGGLFLLDCYGGPEAQMCMTTHRPHAGYASIWEQGPFDLISNRLRCSVHFEFPDGSMLRNAFRYHWRLWSLPELRDVLTEAGFPSVAVYHPTRGVLRRTRRATNTMRWTAFIAAWSGPSRAQGKRGRRE